MAFLVTGRASARADRAGADGASATADSRRAVRRARSGRARAFFAISRTVGAQAWRADARSGDASRRRDYAGVFTCAGAQGRRSSGGRSQGQGADVGNLVAGLPGADSAAPQTRPLFARGNPERKCGDLSGAAGRTMGRDVWLV